MFIFWFFFILLEEVNCYFLLYNFEFVIINNVDRKIVLLMDIYIIFIISGYIYVIIRDCRSDVFWVFFYDGLYLYCFLVDLYYYIS